MQLLEGETGPTGYSGRRQESQNQESLNEGQETAQSSGQKETCLRRHQEKGK
jgi:hypothetical protein